MNVLFEISGLIDKCKCKDDYKNVHEKLDKYADDKKIDIDNYAKLKVSISFREHKLFEAQKLIEEKKNYITKDTFDYLQLKIYISEIKYTEALDFYEQNKSKELEPYKGIIYYQKNDYEKAKELSKIALGNIGNNPALYNQVQACYINSCVLTGDEKKIKDDCIQMLSNILTSENLFDQYALHDNPQYYLFAAFLLKDCNKQDYLNEFFKNTKTVKVFDDILKYSASLKFKPEDCIDAFASNWKEYDMNDYYAKIIDNEPDKGIQDKYIRILFWTLMILAQLMIKNDSPLNKFNYYTSKDVLLKLIQHEYSVAMLSLSNVNDKVEGEVLFDLLRNNNLSPKIDCNYDSDYVALQTSFSRNTDSLTMFRLYGKQDNREGTGVSLTFDKNFFLTDTSYFAFNKIDKDSESDNKSEDNMFLPDYEDGRNPLIWILYYNKDANKLFYYPAENGLVPYEICLDLKKGKWNSLYKNDKKRITENRLLYSFKSLISAINDIPAKKIKEKEKAIQLLERIRYFIKYDDFSEEKECRMLELSDPKQDFVKIIENSSVLCKDYKEIDEISGLTQIILGPKLDKIKIVKELVKKEIDTSKVNPKIKLSNAPLA